MYDMKNLAKFSRLEELAPEAFKAFVAFDQAPFKGGAIPLKYKELMAVAVALTTQCSYCIDIHAKRARQAGATEQELAETTLITAALRAGGAVTHGTHALALPGRVAYAMRTPPTIREAAPRAAAARNGRATPTLHPDGSITYP